MSAVFAATQRAAEFYQNGSVPYLRAWQLLRGAARFDAQTPEQGEDSRENSGSLHVPFYDVGARSSPPMRQVAMPAW